MISPPINDRLPAQAGEGSAQLDRTRRAASRDGARRQSEAGQLSRCSSRGNPANKGPEAPRQFLEILSGEKREPFTKAAVRLDLARDIASRRIRSRRASS